MYSSYDLDNSGKIIMATTYIGFLLFQILCVFHLFTHLVIITLYALFLQIAA